MTILNNSSRNKKIITKWWWLTESRSENGRSLRKKAHRKGVPFDSDGQQGILMLLLPLPLPENGKEVSSMALVHESRNEGDKEETTRQRETIINNQTVGMNE